MTFIENHKRLIKLIIFVTVITILSIKLYPEYKEEKGSSDNKFSTKYDNIIEFEFSNKLDFGLVINDGKIENILFFEKESLCLYNKNIEKNDAKSGLNKIINILSEENYLLNTSSIVIYYYKNNSTGLIDYIKNTIEQSGYQIDLIVENTTLLDRAKTYKIETDSEATALRYIQLLSKENIRYNKFHTSDEPKPTIEKDENLTEDDIKKISDNIYSKLEKYKEKNNVINQDINSTLLPIFLIPGDKKGKIYPTTDSWYYIENNKVYAQINITYSNNTYSFCYQESIDNCKKGQC